MVKFYLHLNPQMLFPLDHIKKNFLNLKIDHTNQLYPVKNLKNNQYRHHLTPKNYYFPRIRESLLFSLCYNANLMIYFPKLDEIPVDFFHFLDQNPFVRSLFYNFVDLESHQYQWNLVIWHFGHVRFFCH